MWHCTYFCVSRYNKISNKIKNIFSVYLTDEFHRDGGDKSIGLNVELHSDIDEHKRDHTAFSSLAKLKTETLSMSRCATKLEVLAAPHAPHTPHASSKESLENAVGVDVVEAVASAVLQVLSAVVHPPLLVVTQYGVRLSNLHDEKMKIDM